MSSLKDVAISFSNSVSENDRKELLIHFEKYYDMLPGETKHFAGDWMTYVGFLKDGLDIAGALGGTMALTEAISGWCRRLIGSGKPPKANIKITGGDELPLEHASEQQVRDFMQNLSC